MHDKLCCALACAILAAALGFGNPFLPSPTPRPDGSADTAEPVGPAGSAVPAAAVKLVDGTEVEVVERHRLDDGGEEVLLSDGRRALSVAAAADGRLDAVRYRLVGAPQVTAPPPADVDTVPASVPLLTPVLHAPR